MARRVREPQARIKLEAHRCRQHLLYCFDLHYCGCRTRARARGIYHGRTVDMLTRDALRTRCIGVARRHGPRIAGAGKDSQQTTSRPVALHTRRPRAAWCVLCGKVVAAKNSPLGPAAVPSVSLLVLDAAPTLLLRTTTKTFCWDIITLFQPRPFCLATDIVHSISDPLLPRSSPRPSSLARSRESETERGSFSLGKGPSGS